MTRLIMTVASIIVQEAAVAVIALLVLPGFGVYVSPPVLIGVMAGLLVLSIISYRIGSRILRKRPTIGLADLSGSRGRAIGSLDPDGMVMVDGEIWTARTTDGRIERGTKITVVRQEGLKLYVRTAGTE